jgi:D-alanyl-D-alanine carboxypeptidase
MSSEVIDVRRPLRLLAGVLALILIAGCAPAPAGLQDLLDRWRVRAGVPAVTVAVGRPRVALWTGASGSLVRGGVEPAPAEVRLRAGSVTKTFVATVVLQLAEAGRVRLDEPLRRALPAVPVGGDATVRQVLDHTSGVPDYGRLPELRERLLAERDRRWSAAEVLALVAGRRAESRPGEAWSYSNTNYVLLGELIRAVTGSDWATEVRRRVIEPLGLRDTFVAGSEPVPGGLVPGYFDADSDGDSENVWDRPWPALETSEGAAGAIVSTAADLARFAVALFEGRLLHPASLAAMVAPGPHHPRFSGYGLGVELLRPDYETEVWGHGGSLPGFRTALWYLPATRTTIVVLVNDARANPADLAELIMRQLRRRG